MTAIELKQILEQKNYPSEFIIDSIKLYPIIARHYGEVELDKFLREWTFVFEEKSLGPSGSTDRGKKEIIINTYNSEFFWAQRFITAIVHEAGHAIGTLETDENDLLSQGHERENFYDKMDEAVVSDLQDDILNGQLQYSYVDGYGFKCRGDANHVESYALEKMLYNVLKILLGEKQDLIMKLFSERNNNKKKIILNTIKEELKQVLDEEELSVLLDMCVSLVINHGYGRSKSNEIKCEDKINNYLIDLYKYNYKVQRLDEKNEEERKEFNDEFTKYSRDFYKKYYERIVEYARQRKIINGDVYSHADRLCTMIVNHIIKKLEMSNEIDYQTLKMACEYLVKINNRNVNDQLRSLLVNKVLSKLEQLNISFDSKIEEKFSRKELFGVIAKLIAIKDFDFNKINELTIMKSTNDGSLYLKCDSCLVKISKQVTQDNVRTFDDSLGNLEVNTCLRYVQLMHTKGSYIGDENITLDTVTSDRKFCKIETKKQMIY